IQPWPEHQRPSRWIIELAMQKALALRAQVQERVKMGDVKFSDSLELMTFLANLIGSEHIERFIPLADPENERALAPAPDTSSTATTVTTATTATTATREMPQFVATKRQAPTPVATEQVARTERKPGAAKPAPKPAPKQPAKLHAPARHAAAKPTAHASADAARDQVIADAARLVQWGRKWFELAELIARMADRPPLPEVRRILKDNKTAIEKKAGRS
ncbi:MAG TPA: hypothetical protein VK251_05835, partial [Steroidobacteraceae bacterium]|nr:hypothetical protein [Steroidobacteraceae bacterium]